MAVIPSFGRYAEAPDLAGAYLGSRRADIAGFEALTQWELGQRRIAQEAAESQARIALGYETLEARKVENEMELAAKQATEQRDHLRKQQEAEILKSYRDTQLGMAERRLKIAEAQQQQRIADVATAFDREQRFQRRRIELKASGMSDADADRQAFLDTSYGQPGMGAAIEGLPRTGQDKMGDVERIRLTSSLENIDREMAEQRKLLAEAEGPKFPEKEREAARNRALRTLRSLEQRRNALFPAPWMVPPESIPLGAPTTPAITNAPFRGSLEAPAMTNTATEVIPVQEVPLGSGLAPRRVTTQAEFDALAPGAEYIGKNGKRYRKPL